MTSPALIQHVSSSANPVGVGISGNAFKFRMPNPIGAGNCLVLGITYPNGSTPTITDNNGNTWPGSPTVTANPGSGTYIGSIFVLPNANAGATDITVTFGSAIIPFQYTLSEVCGVATSSTVNGTQQAVGITGASLPTGAFTPGNNDANGGNIIWNYIALAGGASANPTSWVSGGSFTLLDADIAWTTNQGFPHASQWFIQTTSASINPTITATADTTNGYNCLAVALKIANAGTAAPVGIRVNKVIHQTSNIPPSPTWKLQCPAVGNLRVLATCNSAAFTSISSITDSEGQTWTMVEGAADEPYMFYCPNRSANPNLTVTVNLSAGSPTLTWLFYDISGANTSPFDVAAGVQSTTANGLTVVNAQPPITPTVANGVTIAVMGIGQGPGLGFASGAPAGAVFDLVNYTGETDFDLMENADCQAHLYYSTTAAQSWNWAITSRGSNTVFSTAIAFKAAPTVGLNGWIEYVKIYASAHSLAQVQAQAVRREQTGATWANWKLESAVSTDSSGNGRNLTVSGTPTIASSGVSFTKIAGSVDHPLSAATGAVTTAGSTATPHADRKLPTSTGAVTISGTAATPHADRKVGATTGAATVLGQVATPHADRKLSVTTGTISLSGTSVNTDLGRKIGATSGPITISGQSATTTKQDKLPATSGPITVSGASANTDLGRKIGAASGSISISGQSATITKQDKLPATTGTISLSGTSANTDLGKKIGAASGSVAISGQLVTITKQDKLPATTGSISISGTSVNTDLGRKIGAASGPITVSGTSATTRKQDKLPATTGTISLSGTSANTDLGRKIGAASGSVAISGTSATTRKQDKLPATSGSLVVAGQSSSLVRKAVLPTLTAGTSVVVSDVTLTKASHSQMVLPASGGSSLISGQSAAITRVAKLTTSSGSASISGTSANADLGRKIGAASGSITVSGQSATIRKQDKLPATTGQITIAVQSATVTKQDKLPATSGTISLSGQSATTRKQDKLPATTGQITIAVQSATITKQDKLPATTGTISLSGQLATITKQDKLPATSGSVIVAGQSSSLVRKAVLPASTAPVSIVGSSASMVLSLAQIILSASSASVITNVSSTTITKSSKLQIESGFILASGISGNLSYGRKLLASGLLVDISGFSTAINKMIKLQAIGSVISCLGKDAGFIASQPSDIVVPPNRKLVIPSRSKMLKASKRRF